MLGKHGLNTDGTITHIRTIHMPKGGDYDSLTIAYTNPLTGKSAVGQTSTVYEKYKIGDRVRIAMEEKKSKIIIPADVKGFGPMLAFSIILFLFIVFATIKIREMVEIGY